MSGQVNRGIYDDFYGYRLPTEDEGESLFAERIPRRRPPVTGLADAPAHPVTLPYQNVQPSPDP